MRPHIHFTLCCLLVVIFTGCGATTQTPAPVEQATREYIQTRCEGVDTPCGDWRIRQVKVLTVSPAARTGGADTAWCVDYALQRVNTGRYTSWFWRWANIPESVLVIKRANGQYESAGTNSCDSTVLE